MNASPFISEKLFPAATTCVLVGRMPQAGQQRLAEYRAMLWLTDSAGFKALPAPSVALALDRSSPEALEAAIDAFVTKDPRHLPSVFISSAPGTLTVESVDRCLSTLFSCLEAHHRARITRQKDGFKWQSHVLANARPYLTRSLPDSWEGALAGLPAFVCGAGPSLEFSAPALAKVASSGVVLAADSSLKALAKLGVRADFAVSVDVAKLPEKCLPETLSPERVALSSVSPPSWVGAVPEAQRFYLSSNQLTLDWMASLGSPRTRANVCENCGATAIELARFLGCSPICVFGMDLSMNAEGPVQRHHGAVDATIYKDSGFNAAQQFPLIPGNFTEKVPTHVLGDWRALDQRLASWPEGLVWVVSDRGAKLRNTTVFRPENFKLPEVARDKAQALAALAVPQPAPATARNAIARSLGTEATRIQKLIPGLKAALSEKGPKAAAAVLIPLFTQGEAAKVLGAFSLKLMPHLKPPIEEDPALWQELLTELEALGAAAQAAARDLEAG